ncbi:MAG: hypothetical protein LBD50_01580 [Rickettsiales bacterium]|jgi:hypothetical protein|nr:hypothetical protein [Rickettsiales bacterium]
MKTKNRFFYETLRRGAFAVLCLAPCALFAATDTSCDDERNDFINQRLALCSTHVYNIGASQNPESLEVRQTMNEVVALKTTIMTQQIKKQYDALETTVKRLKTQLEKAILTASMEAAGASKEESSSNSRKSNYIESSFKPKAETINIVRQNLSSIISELSGKSDSAMVSSQIKKQIVKDADNIAAFSGSGQSGKLPDCAENKLSNVANARKCMQDINGRIDAIENNTSQQNLFPWSSR